MLQKVDFDDDSQFGSQFGADRGHLLRPAYYWQLMQRRWAYFLVPFVIIASAGLVTARLLPATYLSEGKILVQSQQIPTELVRPTVTSAAQERIQVIEQRTMTRDNLLAIADKFQLYPDKRALMSASELVVLMRKSARIAPVDLQLDFKQRSRVDPTIVFSVGFESPDPATASRVANELMTRILSEDLRDRTSRATDTTKFLAREVQRLQAENNALDARIAQARIAQVRPAMSSGPGQPDAPATFLGQLKAEFAAKSALYSEKHPVVQSLKRQIDAMEKSYVPVAVTAAPAADPNAAAGVDALVAQQEALQKNLDVASAKLAAAQLGENLEKNQQSEKLEVIEQPTTPQDPIRPNRPKVAGIAVLLALMAGGGLAFGAELMDKGIRRSTDLFGLIDGHLVVSIPYITTSRELRGRRRRMIVLGLGVLAMTVGAVAIAYFFLPPLDLMIAKARVGLFR